MQDIEVRGARPQIATTALDRYNKSTFDDDAVARHYAGMDGPFPGEERALALVAESAKDRPILDIGVGAGRTTAKLLALSADYVGVDYSPAMVEACRRRFPGHRFEVADARDLGRFPSGHFALVLFSFNGIDCVLHAERLTILREIGRLLAPGGAFVFSSHNAAYDRRRAHSFSRRLLGYPADYLATSIRLRFPRPLGAPYTYRSDRAINGKRLLIHYYISKENQVAQLAAVGFRNDAVFNTRGERLSPGGPEADPSPWLYYVAGWPTSRAVAAS